MPQNSRENDPTQHRTAVLSNFDGGMQPDVGDLVQLPGWLNLTNVWLNGSKELRGRPHTLTQPQFTNVYGVGQSHDNELMVAAGGLLYIEGTPRGAISGSGIASFDYSRSRTILTIGDKPVIWDGTVLTTINQPGVFAVATSHGATKERLFSVRTSDPRRLYYSTIGDLGDTGTQIGDEFTEGGFFQGFSHDIIDIIEFSGDIVIFSRLGVYRMVMGEGEFGFNPRLDKIADIEVWKVKPRRFASGILFLNSDGLHVYSIGEAGPFVQPLPQVGVERTLKRTLVQNEAAIGVDETRGLYFLMPNEDDKVWVFHPQLNMYTQWDIRFEDIIEIEKEVYFVWMGELFRFDDLGNGSNRYNATLQSGLLEMESSVGRKRFLTLGVDLKRSDRLDYFLGMDINEINPKSASDSVQPVSRMYEPVHRLECYMGNQGYRGAILIQLRNYGELIINSIHLDYLLKTARLSRD